MRYLQCDDFVVLVRVPLFHFAIFAAREYVVGFWYELQPGDRVVVRENALVTVPKVHAPNFDVSIARPGGDQSGVAGYVHAVNRQFVPVQR